MPISGMRLHELAHLHGGAQAEFTELITMLLEEIKNFLALLLRDALTLKHLA